MKIIPEKEKDFIQKEGVWGIEREEWKINRMFLPGNTVENKFISVFPGKINRILSQRNTVNLSELTVFRGTEVYIS